ncbi:hypothetical protein [Hydrogenimonas sp. SS33]|uniref:hypothetical protein n=1 Tax=Hydrogenimonas leucolamina TaxID=2954236 RepID=UPI00336BC256
MKRWLQMTLCCMVATLGLHAYSAKGMVAYKKLCKQCHGSGFKGAAMCESEEWEAYFADGARKLKEAHAEDEDAMRVMRSRYFKRRFETLGKFLRNNGRDMGVVRSCDGMNCG